MNLIMKYLVYCSENIRYLPMNMVSKTVRGIYLPHMNMVSKTVRIPTPYEMVSRTVKVPTHQTDKENYKPVDNESDLHWCSLACKTTLFSACFCK